MDRRAIDDLVVGKSAPGPGYRALRAVVKAVELNLLALNLGSASLKAAGYSVPTGAAVDHSFLHPHGRVAIELSHGTSATLDGEAQAMLDQAMKGIADHQVSPLVVAHRIVHGGDRPGPMELTQGTLRELEALSPLAPMHQPPAFESGGMRKLLASDTEGARRAIDVYVASLAQGIASMAACIGGIGGIDVLVFSGGIGAHAGDIRAQLAGDFAWMGVEVRRLEGVIGE